MLAAVDVLLEISLSALRPSSPEMGNRPRSILPVEGIGGTVAKIDGQLAAVGWGTFLGIGGDGELVGKPVDVGIGDLSSPIVRPPERQMTQEDHQKKQVFFENREPFISKGRTEAFDKKLNDTLHLEAHKGTKRLKWRSFQRASFVGALRIDRPKLT